METKSREYLESVNKPQDRRYVRILAKEGKRRLDVMGRQNEMSDEDLSALFKRICYSDTTGDEAASHLDNPEECTHNDSVQRRIHHRSNGPVRLDPDVREVVDVVGTY